MLPYLEQVILDYGCLLALAALAQLLAQLIYGDY